MKRKTEIKSVLALQPDIITGFSYSFSKLLLEKLKELRQKGKAFEEKRDDPDSFSKLTKIASGIVEHLMDQMKISKDVSTDTELQEFIQIGEEFLATFEKK